MTEVFIIEKMVVVGVWELISPIFYTSEKEAVDKCLSIMKYMQQNKDKNFSARVTKLTLEGINHK